MSRGPSEGAKESVWFRAKRMRLGIFKRTSAAESNL